jgi:CheY-like chemotaxis protein
VTAINVLLVEDNLGDVLLVREAMDAHEIPYQLTVVSDGEEAVGYMTRMGKSAEEPCPDVLLLDLNIPKAEGADVLREFRRHPECMETPVIVLSSSDTPRDKAEVTALGVTHYFKKPTRFDAFLKLGALVKDTVERATSSQFSGQLPGDVS